MAQIIFQWLKKVQFFGSFLMHFQKMQSPRYVRRQSRQAKTFDHELSRHDGTRLSLMIVLSHNIIILPHHSQSLVVAGAHTNSLHI